MSYNGRWRFAMRVPVRPDNAAMPTRARGRSALEEVPHRLGEIRRLLHVRNVPGAFELNEVRARHRLLDLLDPGKGGILGAADQQGGPPINTSEAGAQVIIRQRLRAAGEALERRRGDHA